MRFLKWSLSLPAHPIAFPLMVDETKLFKRPSCFRCCERPVVVRYGGGFLLPGHGPRREPELSAQNSFAVDAGSVKGLIRFAVGSANRPSRLTPARTRLRE